jgi:hypothetical protein
VIKNPRYKAMAIAALCHALKDPDSSVRSSAAESLGKIGSEEAIPTLSETLNDESTEVRQKVVEALGKIGDRNRMSGDRVINTGGGNYYESVDTGGGNYIQGNYINMSQDLTQAATQIQDLLNQLQKQGMSTDSVQEQVAHEIATEAKDNSQMKDKLVRWGQSLGDATVSDVVKGIVKLALRSAGIPLP